MGTVYSFKEILLNAKSALCVTWYFFIFSVTHIRWTIGNAFNKRSDSFACLIGKTAIVTGGNSGIGYATALLLASRGCKIIIACRRDARNEVDSIKQRTGNPNITSKRLNLCSLKSVRTFSEEIIKDEPKIDILINNAGALSLVQKISEDNLNALMQTNYFGAFLLTHLLVEPMRASPSARIIFVSSAFAYTHRLSLENLNMKDFDEGEFTKFILYSNSKLCNILAAQEFAKHLKVHGILANSADPGVCRTSIIQGYDTMEGNSYWKAILRFLTRPFIKESIDAAQTLFHLAASEKLKSESGQHYFRCKLYEKPKILKDQKFVDEIWRETEKLVQLRPGEKLLYS